MPRAKPKKWNNWEIDLVRKFYPVLGDEELSKKIPSRSITSIHGKATELGLKKKPKEQEKKIKRKRFKKERAKKRPQRRAINLDNVLAHLDKFDEIAKVYDKINSNPNNAALLRMTPPKAPDEASFLSAPDDDLFWFYHFFAGKLKEKYHIDVREIGKSVGKGTMGVAYEYGNSILKATKDMTEAFSSSSIIGRDVPGVVDIYRVILFPDHDKRNYDFKEIKNPPFGEKSIGGLRMAWIIEEKLFKLNPQIRKKLKKRMRKFKKETGEKISFVIGKYHKGAISKAEIQRIFHKLWGRNDLYPGFWSSIITLQKNGVKFRDIHMGNLLQSVNGTLKWIDLGYSESKDRRNAEIVSLEHLMRIINKETDE